ncbi:MAG: toll/interleukin-1 receptor domain-containing protein [Epulopiscium sp.]|nr:toll/interleukin-1 receptor domain-containing protein [Candidatus Epulonipiscium sp.]
MSYIYISYAPNDKLVAEEVCQGLEQRGIKCFVSSRDVKLGQNYGEAILNAIENCMAMVVIFSSNSNSSQQVFRELSKATEKDLTIIPFIVEEIQPSKSMEYYLSVPLVLNVSNEPLEQGIAKLESTIRNAEDPTHIKSPINQHSPSPAPISNKKSSSPTIILAITIVGCFLVIVIFISMITVSLLKYKQNTNGIVHHIDSSTSMADSDTSDIPDILATQDTPTSDVTKNIETSLQDVEKSSDPINDKYHFVHSTLPVGENLTYTTDVNKIEVISNSYQKAEFISTDASVCLSNIIDSLGWSAYEEYYKDPENIYSDFHESYIKEDLEYYIKLSQEIFEHTWDFDNDFSIKYKAKNPLPIELALNPEGKLDGVILEVDIVITAEEVITKKHKYYFKYVEKDDRYRYVGEVE